MTTRRQRLVRAAFRTLDALEHTSVGAAYRVTQRALDPLVYAAWYATEWTRTLNPRTFDEKIRYKMVRDRRPVLTTIADKVAVRDYVAERIGAGYLTDVYQVADAATDVDWSVLPREFVCKVTHASGGAVIVSEAADPTKPLPAFTPRGHGRLVVHPDALDVPRATEVLEHWRRKPYGWAGWKREWAYRNVRPRVLVEEFLHGPDGGIPPDYKMYMLNGEVGFIQLDRDRYGTLSRDLYTQDWEHLPVSKTIPRSNQVKPRPARLDEMVWIAETLSADFDFVRVDLYALADRTVFGELTLYPASGHGPFDPPDFGLTIGKRLAVPARYV